MKAFLFMTHNTITVSEERIKWSMMGRAARWQEFYFLTFSERINLKINPCELKNCRAHVRAVSPVLLNLKNSVKELMGKCLHGELNDGVLWPLHCSFMHMIYPKSSGGGSSRILYSTAPVLQSKLTYSLTSNRKTELAMKKMDFTVQYLNRHTDTRCSQKSIELPKV